MLENLFNVLITAAALLIVCWMLTEFWLRSVRKLSVEKISNLGILDRMAFAFEDFCGGVNHKKDFGRMRVEDEVGSVPMEKPMKPHKTAVADREEKCRGTEFIKKEKKYRTKVL